MDLHNTVLLDSHVSDDMDLLLDCQSLLPMDLNSDAGYHSACSSSFSPASSVDSCCFSPPETLFGGFEGFPQSPRSLSSLTGAKSGGFKEDSANVSSPTVTISGGFANPQVISSNVASIFGGLVDTPVCRNGPLSALDMTTTPVPTQNVLQGQCGERRRSKPRYSGKKRPTASEREKLRMRNLTRALHHLRTYLPASVAPVGQTLTKIETLRLTIRYIAHLSAQLDLSEDSYTQGKDTQAQEGQSYPFSLQHHSPMFQPKTLDCSSASLLQPSHHLSSYSSPKLAEAYPVELSLASPPQSSPSNVQLPQTSRAHGHQSFQPLGSLQMGCQQECFPLLLQESYQNQKNIQGTCSIPQKHWIPPQQNIFYGVC